MISARCLSIGLSFWALVNVLLPVWMKKTRHLKKTANKSKRSQCCPWHMMFNIYVHPSVCPYVRPTIHPSPPQRAVRMPEPPQLAPLWRSSGSPVISPGDWACHFSFRLVVFGLLETESFELFWKSRHCHTCTSYSKSKILFIIIIIYNYILYSYFVFPWLL